MRYVLEGSVRKRGARLRISGQLIDAGTAAHIWADRFDGALDDMFDLQDKVTRQVVGAITPELDRAEMERASRRSTGNIDAVTAYYRGLPHTEFPTSAESNDCAMQHFSARSRLIRVSRPHMAVLRRAWGGGALTSGPVMSPKTTPSYCGLPIG